MPFTTITAAELLKKKVVSIKTAEELLMGPAGRDGLSGSDGVDGKSGKDGQDGKDGLDGTSGRDGRDGVNGTGFTWKGNYSDRVDYQPFDVVNYQGSTYIATTANRTDYPNRVNNAWDLMAASGAAGATGPTGSGGAGSLLWNDYVMNWATEPTQVGTVTEGDVYLYTYDNGTAYRLVPTDGISEDSFYTTFSGGILSGLITTRGMDI